MNDLKEKILIYLPAALILIFGVSILWKGGSLARATFRTSQVSRAVAGWEAQAKTPTEKPGATKPPLPGRPTPPSPGQAMHPTPGRPTSQSAPKSPMDEKIAKMLAKGIFSKKKIVIRQPVCTGVLGSAAIIDGRLIKVGEKAGEWTLVGVTGDKVVIEKDGQKKNIELFPELVLPKTTPKPLPKGLGPSTPPKGVQAQNPDAARRAMLQRKHEAFLLRQNSERSSREKSSRSPKGRDPRKEEKISKKNRQKEASRPPEASAERRVMERPSWINR